MKRTKLTVNSLLGTFSRVTVRTYTHVVVVSGRKAEVLEARRLRDLADTKKTVARYRTVVAKGFNSQDRDNNFDRPHTAARLADGSYAKWIAEYDAQIVALETSGPITQDSDEDNWVAGWCGRLDLAQKLYAQQDEYRHAAIIALDGTVVMSR